MIPPDLILRGYGLGAFPMADDSGRILWFSPDPRGVIPLDRFHVPHGLKRTLRRELYEIRIDTAFDDVVAGCAGRLRTWISGEIRSAYERLHRLGFAHSVEAWRGGTLAGGLYGVALGGAFFGESMFQRETDASKVALAGLVGRLRERGFTLLDIQWTTPHLGQFGAIDIPKFEYLERLKAALGNDCVFHDPRCESGRGIRGGAESGRIV